MPEIELEDTIVAIATPAGPAIRGIVRISGRQAWELSRQLIIGEPAVPDRSANLFQVRLRVQSLDSPLNAQLLLWRGTRSYTGQPLVEIHTLGSTVILQTLVSELNRMGARLARPGEFTLRAFLAGRLDLTQAEAIVGMIDAEDQMEFKLALGQMCGGIRSPLDSLRSELIDVAAQLEAGLDFADEDLEFIAPGELRNRLSQVRDRAIQLANQIRDRDARGTTCRVAIVGPPNVGKSSLFNALLGRDEAITADWAGTTRDYLSAFAQWDEFPLQLIDTAGMEPDNWSSSDLSSVQHETPENRARELDADVLARQVAAQELRQAHLKIVCADSPHRGWIQSRLDAYIDRADWLFVFTKSDLEPVSRDRPWIQTSSRTLAGVPQLRQAIVGRLRQIVGGATEILPATAARCLVALEKTIAALASSLESVDLHAGDELIASDVRMAIDQLGEIVGAVYNDDILDRVFSQFCIGK